MLISKRIDWVDTIKGLCIFCVFLTHSDKLGLCSYNYLFRPFFLTLFFFISGFLYKKVSIIDGIRKIIRGIITPMLFFGFIYLILHIYPSNGETIGNNIVSILKTIFYGDLYWFLSCLVVVQVIYLLVSNIFTSFYKKHKFLLMCVGFIISVYISKNQGRHLPWNIDTAFYTIIFFTMGSIVKDHYDILLKYGNKSKLMPIALLILYLMACAGINNASDLSIINLHDNVFGNFWITFPLSVFGCFSILLISINYNLGCYFRNLGQASIVGYCAHGYAFAVINKVLSLFSLTDFSLISPTLFYLTYCFITGILIIVIYKLINNYCPVVIGKKKQ